jgi:hypothetical protein
VNSDPYNIKHSNKFHVYGVGNGLVLVNDIGFKKTPGVSADSINYVLLKHTDVFNDLKKLVKDRLDKIKKKTKFDAEVKKHYDKIMKPLHKKWEEDRKLRNNAFAHIDFLLHTAWQQDQGMQERIPEPPQGKYDPVAYDKWVQAGNKKERLGLNLDEKLRYLDLWSRNRHKFYNKTRLEGYKKGDFSSD